MQLIYIHRGDYDESHLRSAESVAFLDQDEKLRPQAYQASQDDFNRGVGIFRRGDYQRAVDWAKLSIKAMEYDPTHAQHNYNISRGLKMLAMCYLRLQQYEKGLETLDRDTQEPTNDAMYMRVQMLLQLRRDDEGITQAMEAIRHNNTPMAMCVPESRSLNLKCA